MFRRLRDRLRASLRTPGPLPPSAAEAEQRSEVLAREVVRSTATGNVILQRGDFLTSGDIEREYERVKSYDFTQ